MIVFYLMLLSFSERIGFNFAYLFSSLAIIIPLSLYTLSIMGQKRFAIVMATILFILYLCLFIMLKQDEYALLIGTFIAMFGIYAAMYFTRNLNKDYHQG
ncbi:inner membrane CreD family protein [Campylobacter coli]|nr:inner membrane CreD family protein [Campylobacter coli]EJJ3330810.1 inner membrane CreD family protein [Campylobacter coli]HED9996734.1 inner membrane CreD family protein [Campylobacter coli]HEE0020564.1 inner membrane CreD family protein [Campylobacter coli]